MCMCRLYVSSAGMCGVQKTLLGMPFTSFETGSIISSVLTNLAKLADQLVPEILWYLVSATPEYHYAQYLHVSFNDQSQVLMLVRQALCRLNHSPRFCYTFKIHYLIVSL